MDAGVSSFMSFFFMTQQIQHQLLAIVVTALGPVFLAWTKENSAKVQTSTGQVPCFESYEILLLHFKQDIQSKWNVRRQDLPSSSRSVLKSFALCTCAELLLISFSWQTSHMKSGSFGAEYSCAFTSTDMDFILAEDLDTHHTVHVCVENSVPEKEIKITKKCWERTFAHIADKSGW